LPNALARDFQQRRKLARRRGAGLGLQRP
jgi:hypothetical protein